MVWCLINLGTSYTTPSGKTPRNKHMGDIDEDTRDEDKFPAISTQDHTRSRAFLLSSTGLDMASVFGMLLYISGGTYSLKSTPNDKFF